MTFYQADITYLVADLKYSKENELKICEVQHGCLSALTGDVYVNQVNGLIAPNFTNFFDKILVKKWIVGAIFFSLRKCLEDKGWLYHRSMRTLSRDAIFLDYAKSQNNNTSSISSYKAIVYATRDIVNDFNFYSASFPGVLFIDAASLPYWLDKNKMNILFNTSDELKLCKADWLICSKSDVTLVERLQREMPSSYYVIKPQGEFLGNGVIVVANEDLYKVFQIILNPNDNLKKHPDKRYSYWYRNKDNTFIVEKYYHSDYLQFNKPNENLNYSYDATMRIAFILQYDNNYMTYHCLGGFWKLPFKAIEEYGTLNEKSISCCYPPFYAAIDPELMKEVNIKLEKAMLLFYQVMLTTK